MLTIMVLQAVLFLFLVGGIALFPVNPAMGFIMAAGAIHLSSTLPSSLGDSLEMLLFYGALGGILTTVL